jgi:hypothetical protein
VRELNDDERQYQKILAEAGNFTLEDLAAHRTGMIIKRVYPSDNRSSLLTYFGIALATGLVLMFVTYMAWRHDQNDYRWPGLLFLGLVLLGLAGLFLRVRSNITPERLREYDEITFVDSIEGIPLTIIDKGKPPDIVPGIVWEELDLGDTSCWYEFENGVRFSITPQLYDATRYSHPHRVYHKRGTNELLSIEVLPFSWSPREASSVWSVIAQKSWHE